MATRVPAVAGKVINIGRAGENLATIVEFDVADWIRDFGNSGFFSLYVQQGGGGYYPQNLVQSSAASLTNNIVEWEVTNSNTAIVGLGKCELVYAISGENDNSIIVKSIIYDIVVTNSLDIEAQGSVPSAIESWINEVSQMTEVINNAAPNALLAERYAKGTENGIEITSGAGYQDNAKYYAQRIQSLEIGSVTTGAAGSSAAANVSLSNNTLQLNLTIPRGNTGAQGPSGTIAVDSSVTTGEPGTNASVSNSGSSTAANLHFTIPKGDKGDQGVGFAGTLNSLPTANATNYNTYKDKVWIYNGHAYSIIQSSGSYSWVDGGAAAGMTATLITWS